MSESPQPVPENERPILSSGQFLSWHEKIGDELDLRAKNLQLRLEENPALGFDPDFIVESRVLAAEVELLNRIGNDFSEHSIITAMEKTLRHINGDEPDSSQ